MIDGSNSEIFGQRIGGSSKAKSSYEGFSYLKELLSNKTYFEGKLFLRDQEVIDMNHERDKMFYQSGDEYESNQKED